MVGGLDSGLLVGDGVEIGAVVGDEEGAAETVGAALTVGAIVGAELTDGMALKVGAIVGPLSRSGFTPLK